MHSRFVSLAASLLLGSALAASSSAQQFLGAVSTTGHGQNSAQPFGFALGPNGDVYVSLAGLPSFASPQNFNNNVVVRIDKTTQQIVQDITVGLFPEEIAFTTPPGGAAVGVVTNSTDGTASIFDVATGSVLATVPLPGGFFTAFPFGVETNAAGTRAFVAMGDGSNQLQAIDLDPASATAYQLVAADTITLATGNGGRLARVGTDLVVPSTAFLPGFSGASAFIERHALPGGANPVKSTVVRSKDDFSAYPSTQDVAVGADGIAYVVGFDLEKRVYGFSVATGALVRAFSAGTVGQGHTGLALSPDGKVLVVCDVTSNEVAFLDVARGLPIAVVDTLNVGLGFSQPNDALFSADGSTVYVTVQGNEAVLRFAAPTAPAPFAPTLGLTVAPTSPAQGASVSLATTGALPGELVAIFVDTNDGALDLGPLGVFHLTPLAVTLATASGANASTVVTAPSSPGAYGFNFLCQAIALDMSVPSLRMSDEIPVVLQQ